MNKMIGFMISVTFLSVACFGGDFNALTDADYSAIMGIEKRLYTIRYSFITTPPWQQYPAAHIYCTRLGISHSQMADSILTYATQKYRENDYEKVTRSIQWVYPLQETNSFSSILGFLDYSTNESVREKSLFVLIRKFPQFSFARCMMSIQNNEFSLRERECIYDSFFSILAYHLHSGGTINDFPYTKEYKHFFQKVAFLERNDPLRSTIDINLSRYLDGWKNCLERKEILRTWIHSSTNETYRVKFQKKYSDMNPVKEQYQSILWNPPNESLVSTHSIKTLRDKTQKINSLYNIEEANASIQRIVKSMCGISGDIYPIFLIQRKLHDNLHPHIEVEKETPINDDLP